MGQFSIRLGKVLNSVRTDGFSNSFRKNLQYGRKYIQSLMPKGSGDVLFVTEGVGDSARYRAHNAAEELGLHGLKCAVAVPDNPFLLNYADRFKIFIFHRTIFSPKISKFVDEIKKQKKEIIFETDDLLFDPRFLDQADYLKNINALEKPAYQDGLGAEILDDPYVKACTTTTSYLAEKLGEHGKKVFIVPNKLSDEDLKIAERINQSKSIQNPSSAADKNQNFIRIGYFSGTISHNKDFATVAGALMRIMEKYPQVKLVLAGPLDLENRLNNFSDRIEQLPYVPRTRHFVNVANVDINIVPLQVGVPFCESKSELKFFEAGIVGVPTVAAATRTFKEAIEEGADGFVAGTDTEWFEKLERLIIDADLRKMMGARAREKALANYSNKNSHNGEYYGYLRDILMVRR